MWDCLAGCREGTVGVEREEIRSFRHLISSVNNRATHCDDVSNRLCSVPTRFEVHVGVCTDQPGCWLP